ncbi:osmoprotectant transport system permease protein [Saccharopolyspora antimicrobica]|uniref:Osmoprotectant transport system permease protein n=1 Tax=Saccharopolyspora antimicrobica TaxID=455193 RepID=A0A1I4X5V1_9PSEU|nr:ABC transporter permease [Saccharopolyspora antimicrobica]RKT84334.1 osmoprotectant transport system permease protein [Saccharopolyspora antimicrobica]SFN21254.1 osmoprotectant transport system permease protein [Saccharopolyspora antimicrobica]
MNFLDYVASRWQSLLVDSYQHASMVLQCIVLATIVGVLVGVAVYRSPAGAAIATALSSAVLTIPSFALFGLLIPVLGLGVAPSVLTLVLYALLPIVRNTIVGLSTVDQPILDAARGIGMGRFSVLTRIELRLAWPAILAGMRVSTQMLMGIAAIAAYAKGPGLGNLIFSGLGQLGGANALNMAVAGTVGVIILALLLDALFVLIGRLTTSRGIRG